MCILNEIHPAHEFTSFLSLVSSWLPPLFSCIAPGFAQSILKYPKATTILWTLHRVTDIVSQTLLVVLTQETLIIPLQSSVMFDHCSCIPTTSTCEFQQSFWACSIAFFSCFCVHLLCAATSVASYDFSCSLLS